MDRERVVNVVKQMTLDEKVALTEVGADLFTAAVPRLKVPAMRLPRELGWYSPLPKATFAAIGHTFDRELASDIAKVRSREAVVEGESFGAAVSLGVARKPFEPTCARAFSEDPLVVSEMARGYIGGSVLRCIGTYITGIKSHNRYIGERALGEIYLRPFESLKGELGGIALSGALGGVPVCEHRSLMRRLTAFDGLILTLPGEHGYKAEEVSSGACLDIAAAKGESERLKRAVESGLLYERKLDACVERTVLAAAESYSLRKTVRAPAVSTNEKLALRRRLFDESTVLLKNDGALPILSGEKTAVVNISPQTAKNALRHIERQVRGADKTLILLRQAHLIPPETVGEIVNAVKESSMPILAASAPCYFPMPYIKSLAAAIFMPCDAGDAAADFLSEQLRGERDFGGRLAFSWAREKKDYPYAALGFDREGYCGESVYVGNRYFERSPNGLLFPFGHGLSFSRVEIDKFRVERGEKSVATFDARADRDTESVAIVSATLDDESVFGVSGQTVAFARLALSKEWRRFEIELSPVTVSDIERKERVRLGGKYTFTLMLSDARATARATAEGEKVPCLSKKALPSYYFEDGKIAIEPRQAELLTGALPTGGAPAPDTKKADKVLMRELKKLKRHKDAEEVLSSLSEGVRVKIADYYTGERTSTR